MVDFPVRYHRLLIAAKYGVAAAASVALGQLWVPKDLLSVSFVALVCLQPSIVSGFRRGAENFFGSALGLLCSFVVQLVLPISAWSVGLSIAVTYALCETLRWGFPTLVVALFSSIYMATYFQGTLTATVALRLTAVLLGFGVAVIVNAIFAYLAHRANYVVRLDAGLRAVARQLHAVSAPIGRRDAVALASALEGFGGTYRLLTALQDEVSDVRREFRLLPRPGGLSLTEVYFGDRALRELEDITHHAQDVAAATLRMLKAHEASGGETAGIGRFFDQVVRIFDQLSAGNYAVAGEAMAGERERLLAAVEADRQAGGEPTAHAIALLGAIQLEAHLRELLTVSERFAQAAPAVARA